MLEGILIKDNQAIIVQYEDTLDELHKLVGGYIEYVPVEDNIYMIVDEEGKIKGKEINYLATNLIPFDDVIVGDALIVGTMNGENISLTEEQVDRLMKRIQDEQ